MQKKQQQKKRAMTGHEYLKNLSSQKTLNAYVNELTKTVNQR